MQKVVVRIQGRTLILPYQVKSGVVRDGVGGEPYIQVQPAGDLSRFHLRGLTPEMFCVNISDAVNIRRQFSGLVENEQQLPVAQWTVDREDYLKAIRECAVKLTHLQVVNLLQPLSGYVGEADGEFIDLEEKVVPHEGKAGDAHSGYRLTVATEDAGERIAPYAYYSFDVWQSGQWRDNPPPAAHQEAVRMALARMLQVIRDAGVHLTKIYDQTDYAVGAQGPVSASERP